MSRTYPLDSIFLWHKTGDRELDIPSSFWLTIPREQQAARQDLQLLRRKCYITLPFILQYLHDCSKHFRIAQPWPNPYPDPHVSIMTRQLLTCIEQVLGLDEFTVVSMACILLRQLEMVDFNSTILDRHGTNQSLMYDLFVNSVPGLLIATTSWHWQMNRWLNIGHPGFLWEFNENSFHYELGVVIDLMVL